MGPDFSGWATKANLKCADGRVIMPEAFAHMDGKKVPLVWSHRHDDPGNVLGHAILSAKPEGIWADAYFNGNPKAVSSKVLVQHDDVDMMSIWANKLVERANQVFHGVIREVSLVLSGANPGATIENVNIAHSDGYETLDDEVIINIGKQKLVHGDPEDEPVVEKTDEEVVEKKDEEEVVEKKDEEKTDEEVVEHAADDTAEEIYNTFNDEQKTIVHYMIGKAVETVTGVKHSQEDNNDEGDLTHQEGTDMTRSIFEKDAADKKDDDRHVLSHSDIDEIKENWKRTGSMRQAVETFGLAHGIENLDSLFPDPKALPDSPQFDQRRMEWVDGVLNGCKHSPFSRIKTLWADITHEEARARGYIKGNLKKEEFFKLTKRTTRPATIYKKQKLDRDDILDATELDVVAWMKAEMRMMLKEECARAILIGDGRPVEDPANPGEPNPDKVKDPQGQTDGEGIRSILHDDELFAATVNIEIDPGPTAYQGAVEQIMLAMELYKGTGSPTFYTTLNKLNRMILSKDGFGRRLWRTKAELATEMGVADIVTVDVMGDEADLLGIIVNLQDYNVGTDAGGEVNLFDDFDIDYNQYKYLIETRFSGALVKIRSALVIKIQPSSSTLIEPEEPTFDGTDILIPTDANVAYFADGDPAADGSTVTVDPGATVEVTAVAAAGYYFANNVQDQWSFTNDGA